LLRSEHALYLQWCHFAEATMARPLGEMVNHRREFDPPQDEILAEMASRGQLCVKAIDEALADGREFILGDEFSAADISIGQSPNTSPCDWCTLTRSSRIMLEAFVC
jgi:glutathione S-transferase